MKYLIFMAIFMAIFISCDDNNSQKEEDKTSCNSWLDCHVGEICVDNFCKASEDHLCPENSCPLDMNCNTITQFCEAESCSKHVDCGAGRFCDTSGYCKTKCISDSQCGTKYECNQSTGECNLKAEENCTTKGCPDDQECDTVTGLCNPKEIVGCTDDFECYPQICDLSNGACKDDPMYCTGAGQCPDNYECNTSSNRCEPLGGESCEADIECEGEYCDPELHVCVQCLEDSQCTEGVCDQSAKRCFVTQHCQNDGECPDGTKCISEDGVFSGGDGFPGMPGQETTTGTCQEYTACYVDTDCPEEDGEQMLCKDATETSPGYCAKKAGNGFEDIIKDLGICDDQFLPCSEGVCIKAEGELLGKCYEEGNEPECTADSECAALHPDETSPMICQRGQCMVDPTPRCTQESDCETETMHNMHCDTREGVCYSCVTDEHCDGGASCNDHNCVSSSFCESDGDCSNGMTCQANLCTAN